MIWTDEHIIYANTKRTGDKILLNARTILHAILLRLFVVVLQFATVDDVDVYDDDDDDNDYGSDDGIVSVCTYLCLWFFFLVLFLFILNVSYKQSKTTPSIS